MDTSLYDIAKALIMPPGGIIVALLMGFLLVRGVLGRVLILAGLTLLTLMSLPQVAASLVRDLEPYPALTPEASGARQAQAILVLGADRYSWAPEFGGDTVGAKTLQRLRYAARLQRGTGLPVYVAGGSPPHEHPPLGRLMARVLREELGVSVAGVEDRSRTTWENAERSARMLAQDGIRRILLVTHAWHLPRAMDAFERAGLEPIPAPTAFIHREGGGEDVSLADWLPSATAFSVSYYALHEWLGQAWYRLKSDGRPD
jgi:uncharacterized SAM-binding protein YcdF (DUF218 family)